MSVNSLFLDLTFFHTYIHYVKFETGTSWQIDTVPEPNVYPVTVQKHAWFLDHQRKRRQLRIWRKQFPLAPGFAITAHVAQGQTITEGVIADLCLGYAANPFTAFVAVTRVKGREYLLIYRPFEAAPFQKGVGLGRELLLRHLRQEHIDWKALLAKYCEERPCANCHERKNSDAYTFGQWKRDDSSRVCRECSRRHAAEGCPWQCHICKGWYPETQFPAKHQRRQCSFYRVCLTCEDTKPCSRCGQKKPENAFGPLAWRARHADRRVCKACANKVRGQWACATCAQRLPIHMFTVWQSGRASKQDGAQKCNGCVSKAVARRFARSTIVRLNRARARLARSSPKKIVAVFPADTRQQVNARQVATSLPGSQEPAEKKRKRQENDPKAQQRIKRSKTEKVTPPQDAHTLKVQRGSEPTPAAALPPVTSHKRRKKDALTGSDADRIRQTYTYVCPHCHATVRSKVLTGRVNHRAHCGKQFWVQNGVQRPARTYRHRCPQCGVTIQSSQPYGRVQCAHKTPRGRQCRRTQWTVKP
eukprot:Skav201494  [mRNA]  locus=scaffold1154:7077:8669:+ [translate_table: standard]